MVTLTVSAQLLIKKKSQFIKTNLGFIGFIKSIINRYIISAAFFVFLAPFFYIIALSRIDLSIAFVFTGLNYPLVTLGSNIFLKENINKNHILGILLISIGFFIFNK